MPSKTLETLSEREKEILKHFCYSNTEIGKMLKISRLTVKSHSHNILSKLNCKSRTAALVEAIKQDLINPQEIHIKGKEEEEECQKNNFFMFTTCKKENQGKYMHHTKKH